MCFIYLYDPTYETLVVLMISATSEGSVKTSEGLAKTSEDQRRLSKDQRRLSEDSKGPLFLSCRLKFRTIDPLYTAASALDAFILDTAKQVLWQTMKTKVKCCVTWHFIRVCTVC